MLFTRGVLNSDLMNVELQMITGHLAGLGLARERGDGGGDKEAARTLALCHTRLLVPTVLIVLIAQHCATLDCPSHQQPHSPATAAAKGDPA